MPQIDTRLPVRRPSEDEPQSVIHAPSDYKSFESSRPTQKSPTEGSENTVVSPPSPEAVLSPTDRVGCLAQSMSAYTDDTSRRENCQCHPSTPMSLDTMIGPHRGHIRNKSSTEEGACTRLVSKVCFHPMWLIWKTV